MARTASPEALAGLDDALSSLLKAVRSMAAAAPAAPSGSGFETIVIN